MIGGRYPACVAASLAIAAAGAARAETLTINANTSDPAPRAAWEEVVGRFRALHPRIAVEFNVYDHESYKKSIRNWLTGASPDVVFWNAGNRMRQFVGPGLLEDVSQLFTAEVRAELEPAAIDLVTVEGRQYGAPYAYYQVGLFFRRDLLEQAGVPGAPRDWEKLLEACERLKAIGIVPITIGTKDLWPAAAWFDYIDLRLNGFAFHMDLMAGRIPYTDERVRRVFAKWRELLERGCFVETHASVSWQESQAQLSQGTAAMTLMGSFIVPNFPPEVRDRIDLARFPAIDPDVALAEDAPMNALHIPAKAQSKDAARTFLAFVLRADVQESISAALRTIPVNRKARVSDDPLLHRGRELLASAEHLAQYFDRDTNEALATVAMKGFQEFMVKPERLDVILETIERARKRVYM